MQPETARNGPPNRDLPPRHEALALALAAGSTLHAAAAEAGIGATTAKRWLREQPAIIRRVGELRAEMTAQALGRLIDNMASAADTLAYLSRKAESETVRLGAARAVLELANKTRETVELEERLQALEKQVASKGSNQWQSRIG
jgi:hypothetical protein